MAKLAIKGHPSHSKEIIEILEMLGGKNTRDYVCNIPDFAYSINEQEIIEWFMSRLNSPYTIFTLEEFLEKYPYKVGEKVLIKPYVGARQICEMRWDSDDNCIKYGIGVGEWFHASQVQPYKEETMEENTNTTLSIDLKLKGEDYSDKRFCYKIPNGYEIDCIKNNEIILKPIKSQYPKTYEESCKVLNLTKYPPALTPNKAAYINQYKDFPCYYEIQKLAQLLVCRNAYWKIAGEQMGLGKPWEPDFTANVFYPSVIIEYDEVVRRESKRRNTVLVFPTTEMRDAFYENFKKEIEECKELL